MSIFDESLVVGKGGFGKVYKGVIDDGSCIVAIKRLNPLFKKGASEFWGEIKILSKFRHSHLVCLIAHCDQNDEMILVYEFMIRGSLANRLNKISKNRKSNLSSVQRLKECVGAARGLDYLHTGTTLVERVIHRDVKSSNILLDENWAAKISDFGLCSPRQNSTHVSTKHIKGKSGYMDPDYFLTCKFTRKSVVYAFGVVLLEVSFESLAGWASMMEYHIIL
jgi:serine/threonine protein kinase